MAIEESSSIWIDIEEIKLALKKHLIEKGYNIESIHFRIDGEEDPYDTFSQMPLSHVLKGADIKVGNKIKI
ncbi:hypothetical protein KAR91_00545 [Candidatus Pacearchaeota archaeon]|nr:hypothetical protein [Candidatus Pacearchaeota archaeon]